MTDPAVCSGIGNAYSHEILHRAPVNGHLDRPQAERLYESTRDLFSEWVKRLCQKCGGGFPERGTAFREGMAVHGRYGKPCSECGAPVQRI
ncbi:MAG: hypothetical protein OXC19_17460 [Bryobacterales bacterium]|nr:hypothetical protein [Bryobacterales bacterium]